MTNNEPLELRLYGIFFIQSTFDYPDHDYLDLFPYPICDDPLSRSAWHWFENALESGSKRKRIHIVIYRFSHRAKSEALFIIQSFLKENIKSSNTKQFRWKISVKWYWYISWHLKQERDWFVSLVIPRKVSLFFLKISTGMNRTIWILSGISGFSVQMVSAQGEDNEKGKNNNNTSN